MLPIVANAIFIYINIFIIRNSTYCTASIHTCLFCTVHTVHEHSCPLFCVCVCSFNVFILLSVHLYVLDDTNLSVLIQVRKERLPTPWHISVLFNYRIVIREVNLLCGCTKEYLLALFNENVETENFDNKWTLTETNSLNLFSLRLPLIGQNF